MENKILVIGAIILVLLLVLGVFLKSNSNGNSIAGSDLEKYRSEKIPQECRLPENNNDLNAWKEHLGHHQNTLYCLDYYK